MNTNSNHDSDCVQQAFAKWRKSTIDVRPFEQLPSAVQGHILLQAQLIKENTMKNDIRYGFVLMTSSVLGLLFAFAYVFAR